MFVHKFSSSRALAVLGSSSFEYFATHSLWMRIFVSMPRAIYIQCHPESAHCISVLSVYVIGCHRSLNWIASQPMPFLMLLKHPLSQWMCKRDCCRFVVEWKMEWWSSSVLRSGYPYHGTGEMRDEQVTSLLCGCALCEVQLLCMNEPNWNVDAEMIKYR